MKSFKFIDKDSYEILDYNNYNCFKVDTLIANCISILNKKGYITIDSCAGHILGEIEMYDSIKFKDDITNNIEYDVLEIKDDYIRYIYKPVKCYIFISFDDIDKVKDKINSDNIFYNSVIYTVQYYKDKNYKKRKSDSQIVSEIVDININLLEWAKSLPNIKNKKLENVK